MSAAANGAAEPDQLVREAETFTAAAAQEALGRARQGVAHLGCAYRPSYVVRLSDVARNRTLTEGAAPDKGMRRVRRRTARPAYAAVRTMPTPTARTRWCSLRRALALSLGNAIQASAECIRGY